MIRKALNEVLCLLMVSLIAACAVVAGYRLQATEKIKRNRESVT